MKMNPISRISIEAIRAKNIKLEDLKIAAILHNQDELTNLNRDQMREGLTSKGVDIEPYYSAGYSWLKDQMPSYHASNGAPDLYFTGAFQKAMHVSIRSNKVSFSSSDNKTSKLTEKYGEEIFGIMPDNQPQSVEIVTNEYVKKVHEFISGGLE